MWQSGSACYSSPALANRAAASVQSGAVVPLGGDSAVVSVGAVTDTSIQYVLTSITTGATASRLVVVNPPECGLLTGSDGLAMGWAVFGVWTLAWGFAVLARMIRDMVGGGDGNA